MDNVLAHSKDIIERGSESFAAAARLFSPHARDNAYLLYAWCRHCDDSIDGQVLGFNQQSPAPHKQLEIVETLRNKTRAALAGEDVDDPVFVALQRVAAECDIDDELPLALLDGFEMDANGRRYREFDDLLDYCYHVAGVVGAMMAKIMGVRDEQILARAIDLGLAFQLTNICRDVLEDAADGRIYLPEAWLEEAGVPLDPTQFPEHTVRLAGVTQRVLIEAERYYDSARHGIAYLPWRCAWAVSAALLIYREIGIIVSTRGRNAWASRAGAGSMRKLSLLFRGGLSATRLKMMPPVNPRPADLWQQGAALSNLGR